MIALTFCRISRATRPALLPCRLLSVRLKTPRCCESVRTARVEILVSRIPATLSFAVILSGGKIEMPGLKVSLPPLGTGVLALRRALGWAVDNRLGSNPTL